MPATTIHAAVSDRDGTAEFLEVTSGLTQMGGLIDHYDVATLQRVRRDERHSEIAVTVPSTHLDTLLRAHGLQEIDYLSIDVEGAERAVLGSLDFDEFDITALSIENSRPGCESYEDIMDPAGYWRHAQLADNITTVGFGAERLSVGAASKPLIPSPALAAPAHSFGKMVKVPRHLSSLTENVSKSPAPPRRPNGPVSMKPTRALKGKKPLLAAMNTRTLS